MFTSSIAQLLTAAYSPLSPATNIESLYIEKIKGQDVANNTLVVERRSVYKNFPIAIHNNPVIASFSDTDVISKTDSKLYNFPNHHIIKPGGGDIYVAQFKEKHKTSSSGKRLLGIDTVQYNLSVILSNYVTKSNFDASRNTFLNGSNSGFNNRYNALEEQITDINSSITSIKNNVSTLNATVLDKFLNGAIHTNDGVPYASVPVDMTSGEFYLYHYKPNQADNSNAFLCVCMAVDSTTVSSKVYMLPYVAEYCDVLYQFQQLDRWTVRMKQTNDTLEVIYMKDEKDNEARYDFKYHKTFKLYYQNNPYQLTLHDLYMTQAYDLSLQSNCKHNVIRNSNPNAFEFIILSPTGIQTFIADVQDNIIEYGATGILLSNQKNIVHNFINSKSMVRLSWMNDGHSEMGLENNIIDASNNISNIPNSITPLGTSYFYNNVIGAYNTIDASGVIGFNNIKNNNTISSYNFMKHCDIRNNNTCTIHSMINDIIYNNCSLSGNVDCINSVFYNNNVSTFTGEPTWQPNIKNCIFGQNTVAGIQGSSFIHDNIYVDGSIYASDFYSAPLS